MRSAGQGVRRKEQRRRGMSGVVLIKWGPFKNTFMGLRSVLGVLRCPRKASGCVDRASFAKCMYTCCQT